MTLVDRAAAWLDTHHRRVFAAVAVVVLATIARRAAVKPFWHDELYTILLSRLPSIADIWRATRDGIDLSPPLTAFLTRFVHDISGVGHVVSRLPALAGFALMMACIFAFVRRRAGAAAALSAALIPFFTAAQRYAYEARGYGPMLGFAALALYCWSEAAHGRLRRRNLVGVAIGVAASVWTHYYAVLVVVALAAGELIRIARQRRIDWGIVGALAAGTAATFPLALVVRGAAQQKETFWADPPTVSAIGSTYRFLFQPLFEPVFLIAAVAVAGAAIATRMRRLRDDDREGIALTIAEKVVIALLVLLPFGGYVLGKVATGVFVPRYFLAAVIGTSIAISVMVHRLGGRRASMALAVALTSLALASAVKTFIAPASQRNPFAARPLLAQSLRSGPPTVVQANIHFLQLWYYAPPELKGRMQYLVDVDESVARLGNDTVDRGYAGLARCCAIPAPDASEFLQRYSEFNLYVVGNNWLVDKLRADGLALEEMGREPGAVLLRVRRQ